MPTNTTMLASSHLRDNLLAIVHDEHAAHVQLDVVQLFAGVKHVEGSTLGQVEDGPARCVTMILAGLYL